MASKKRSSSAAKPSNKEGNAYQSEPGRAIAEDKSTFMEPAELLTRPESYAETSTRKAVKILNPYRASFKSPAVMLSTIKQGLAAEAIGDLIEITGATQVDLAHILDLTEPTLRKHIRAGKELNTALSEHILQLFKLFDKGMDTFGSLEEFKAWLKHDSIGLPVRPLDLLDTITGINMVMDQLIRIDYGITV